ncbi:MAG: lipA [Magnetococcales bacterium]|nr:lipA [Magnetococcales bacterium]
MVDKQGIPGSKPRWLKVKAPGSAECLEVERLLKGLKLHTVCQSASCPNRGQCWDNREAAFMILGIGTGIETCRHHLGQSR